MSYKSGDITDFPFGDCRDETVVEHIFGSVSEFARIVEERGNTFSYGLSYYVKYDEVADIHYFYRIIP